MTKNDPIQEKLIKAYQREFSGLPEVLVSAPGRINLIGEHTDYSEGFVLPVAIDLKIMIALGQRDDKRVKLFSLDLDENRTLDLENLHKGKEGWTEYIKGVAWVLQNHGYDLSGWQGVMSGTIPIGAGLSSSAALETAAIKAFCYSDAFELSVTEVAKLGQEAEVNWVGVNVGIMDQLISAAGKANYAVLLDCQSLDFNYIPIPPDIQFIVLDTMTRRELTTSDYNRRHEEVKTAANILGFPTLRYVNLPLLEQKRTELTPMIYHRAKHVITENVRVQSFCKAMRSNNIVEMGRILNSSHASLRDDFGVSSRELDVIVNLAQNHETCLGARMMGAGFGGCALAIIRRTNNNSFIQEIHRAYHDETKIQPEIFPVHSADGVHIIELRNLKS